MKKTVIVLIILTVSTLGYGITIPQVVAELSSHMQNIQSLEADLEIRTSGTGKIIEQKGVIQYTKGVGTIFTLSGDTPMEVKITERGTVIVNGQQQSGTHTSGQMGDIFFLNLINMYKLKVLKEDTKSVTLAGYDPEEKLSKKKLLTALYDKERKVLTSINYKGDVADYPYRMKITYQVLQGIPIVQTISTFTSAFSVTITSSAVLKNVILTPVPAE